MLFVDDFQVLIAPGLHNSDAYHWQSRWQELYPAFIRVEQKDWAAPDLPGWSAQLGHAVARARKPVIVVAHSFACLATVAYAARNPGTIAAALLVGPADPQKFKVAQELENVRLPFPSLLIASENDPWMSACQASYWASCWGSDYLNIGRAGHINSESRLGEWLFGLAQLQRLSLKAYLSLPAVPLARFSSAAAFSHDLTPFSC